MADLTTGIMTARDAGATAARGGRRVLAGLWRVLLLWHRRARQRRDLAGLDEHLLRDIGVDRLVAGQEARKRFWRR